MIGEFMFVVGENLGERSDSRDLRTITMAG